MRPYYLIKLDLFYFLLNVTVAVDTRNKKNLKIHYYRYLERFSDTYILFLVYVLYDAYPGT